MLPRQHLLYGILFTIFLFFLIPNHSFLGLSLFLLSTVLIDADHYLYYIYKTKDTNFVKCLKYFNDKVARIKTIPIEERSKYYFGLYIFHGFEVLLLLLVLGFLVSPLFFYILLGFNFHLFLDMISDYHYRTKSYKYSIFININKSRRLKHF